MSKRKRFAKVFGERLRSTYLGRSFEQCGDCGRSFGPTEISFITTKEYHYDEVVMEYAVCSDCNERHQKAWSDESRDTINRIFQEAAGAEEDWRPVALVEGDEAETSYDHCWITGTPITEGQAFQVLTIVQPEDGERVPTSILLSYEGMETIQTRLSRQTRDERDRWREEVQPGPPSGLKIPEFWNEPVLA